MPTTIANRRSIAEALRQNAHPLLRRLAVVDNDEEVVIQGTVSSYYLKQLAQETIRPLLDGRRLVNRIDVALTE